MRTDFKCLKDILCPFWTGVLFEFPPLLISSQKTYLLTAYQAPSGMQQWARQSPCFKGPCILKVSSTWLQVKDYTYQDREQRRNSWTEMPIKSVLGNGWRELGNASAQKAEVRRSEEKMPISSFFSILISLSHTSNWSSGWLAFRTKCKLLNLRHKITYRLEPVYLSSLRLRCSDKAKRMG